MNRAARLLQRAALDPRNLSQLARPPRRHACHRARAPHRVARAHHPPLPLPPDVRAIGTLGAEPHASPRPAAACAPPGRPVPPPLLRIMRDATCAPIHGSALNGAIAAHTAPMDAAPRRRTASRERDSRVFAQPLRLGRPTRPSFCVRGPSRRPRRSDGEVPRGGAREGGGARGERGGTPRRDGGGRERGGEEDGGRRGQGSRARRGLHGDAVDATLVGAVALRAARAASAGEAPIAPLKARCAAALHAT